MVRVRVGVLGAIAVLSFGCPTPEVVLRPRDRALLCEQDGECPPDMTCRAGICQFGDRGDAGEGRDRGGLGDGARRADLLGGDAPAVDPDAAAPICGDGEDRDGDGRGEGCPAGPDCDDTDADIWVVIQAFPDRDGDGHAVSTPDSLCTDGTVPSGYLASSPDPPDCDDDPATCGAACHPGRAEMCDGLDNDCDPGTGCADDWWDTGWSRRRRLLLDNRASGRALVDFPVLVALTPQRFDFSAARDRGQDARFVDADGTTVLAHEVESWSSGDARAWVRVPRIDAGVESDFIWFYYGNPSAASGADPDQVWLAPHRAVFHLRQTTTNSVSGGQDAVAVGAVANDDGYTFDGSSAWVDLGRDLALLRAVSAVTLTARIRPSTTITAGQTIVGISIHGDPQRSRATIALTDRGTPHVAAQPEDDQPLSSVALSGPTLPAGVWSHLAATFDFPGDRIAVFVDGVPVHDDSFGFGVEQADATLSDGGAIGAEDDGSRSFFRGRLSDVRVVAAARSADWIRAAHMSEGDLGLVGFGEEQRYP